MCTLSLIRPADPASTDPRWRVVFNRDERRSRPLARPPLSAQHGAVQVVFPIDPVSHGTWIAATSARLVLAILNESEGESYSHERSFESRGTIIPKLCGARTSAEAVRRAQSLDAGAFRPFCLVIIDDCEVRELVSDGRAILPGRPAREERWMRTSSSVDPDAVRAIRTAVFERLVTEPSRTAQDCFHAYAAAERPEAGVHMSRADACTVSVTTIDVSADGLEMTYRPLVRRSKPLAPPWTVAHRDDPA